MPHCLRAFKCPSTKEAENSSPQAKEELFFWKHFLEIFNNFVRVDFYSSTRAALCFVILHLSTYPAKILTSRPAAKGARQPLPPQAQKHLSRAIPPAQPPLRLQILVWADGLENFRGLSPPLLP